MQSRKIQLIAGTTYSVSLPKEWVRKNGLKEQSEVLFYEKGDRTLVLSPQSIDAKSPKEISLNIDDHIKNIDQILFAVYYLGIENVNLFSRNGLTKDIGAKIRKTITYMSGTEISYEDNHKISIKVLLDKSKVDIVHVIYRISLIIDSSIENMMGDLDIAGIMLNENEIDRLYHLITKIVSLSLVDSSILQSSGIGNISLAPSYSRISKRLENIGDNINHISGYMHKNRITFENSKEILNFIRAELNRSINMLIGKQNKVFEKKTAEELKEINGLVLRIKNKVILNYLEDIIRYVIDTEEEIVNITFYSSLMRSNNI